MLLPDTLDSHCFFFFSSRRRHTRCYRDWSSDVCSSDLGGTRKWPLIRYGFAGPGSSAGDVGGCERGEEASEAACRCLSGGPLVGGTVAVLSWSLPHHVAHRAPLLRARTTGRVTTSLASDSGASTTTAAALRGQQSGPPISRTPPFTNDRRTPPNGSHAVGPHSGQGAVGVGGAARFWKVPQPARLTKEASSNRRRRRPTEGPPNNFWIMTGSA